METRKMGGSRTGPEDKQGGQGQGNSVPSLFTQHVLLPACPVPELGGPWGLRSEHASRVPWNKLGQ